MLLLKLRKAFKQAADPARATSMQAYMKSAMPYHGVPTAARVEVCNAVFANAQFASAASRCIQVVPNAVSVSSPSDLSSKGNTLRSSP